MTDWELLDKMRRGAMLIERAVPSAKQGSDALLLVSPAACALMAEFGDFTLVKKAVREIDSSPKPHLELHRQLGIAKNKRAIATLVQATEIYGQGHSTIDVVVEHMFQ